VGIAGGSCELRGQNYGGAHRNVLRGKGGAGWSKGKGLLFLRELDWGQVKRGSHHTRGVKCGTCCQEVQGGEIVEREDVNKKGISPFPLKKGEKLA